RESSKMKWQDMWDKTEKGRHLFNYRNQVGLNLEHKYQSTKGEISVIQLRTGYVRLNEYLQKTRDVYLQGLASYLFHQYYCLRVNRVYAEINTFLPPFSKRLFIAMIHRKV
ncbi:MAG: hypothetical protein ABW116_16960, partial [Candidatus Sedimenticola sp. 20ELBAFRAG]